MPHRPVEHGSLCVVGRGRALPCTTRKSPRLACMRSKTALQPPNANTLRSARDDRGSPHVLQSVGRPRIEDWHETEPLGATAGSILIRIERVPERNDPAGAKCESNSNSSKGGD